MKRGSKQFKDTTAQQSRTQQFQMSSRQASPPSPMTMCPNPHLLHLEEDGHSSKHIFLVCQTNPIAALKKHPLSQRSLRSCATYTCLTYVAVPLGRECRPCHNTKRLGNRSYTEIGECRLCGSFLDPHTQSMEKLAAPPKPLGRTRHAFTPSQEG